MELNEKQTLEAQEELNKLELINKFRKLIDKAEWKECNGEAHSPEVAGNIDHCGICMPYWGSYPICPIHKTRLTDKGLCKTCNKHYEVRE
jgi:hypothetical protein